MSSRDEALAELARAAREAGEDARRALDAAGPKVIAAFEGVRQAMAAKR